jgi:putative transposase
MEQLRALMLELTCPRTFPQSDVDSAQPEGADEVRKNRFTEAQIIGMTKEHEAGLPTAELCWKQGLSHATFYKLKAKYGGMDLSDAKRLKQLEDENAKLKRIVAEVMLDNVVLKDILGKP